MNGKGGHKRIAALLRWGLSLGLLAALLLWAGPGRILAVGRQLDPTWVAVVVLTSLAQLALGALNVWLLLRALQPLAFRDYAPAYLVGWGVGLFFPGPLGDASQILVLRRQGRDVAELAAAYLVDKAITLTFLSLVALAGVARLLPLQALWQALAAWALLAALAGGSFWALARTPDGPGQIARAGRFARELVKELRRLRGRKRQLLLNLALTVLKWGVLTVCYLAAFRAVAVALSPGAAATIPFMSTLVGYLPISAGGVGIVEWSAVGLFAREGVTEEAVVAVYLLLRAIQYGLAALLLPWRPQTADPGD